MDELHMVCAAELGITVRVASRLTKFKCGGVLEAWTKMPEKHLDRQYTAELDWLQKNLKAKEESYTGRKSMNGDSRTSKMPGLWDLYGGKL